MLVVVVVVVVVVARSSSLMVCARSLANESSSCVACQPKQIALADERRQPSSSFR